MWSDNICYLGSYLEKDNDFGDTIKEIIYSENHIFCEEKSVKYSEFYQAQAVGLKPEIVLKVNTIDYNKEQFVKYEEEEYTVLRTYRTSKEKIELTLVRGVNNVSTT